MAQKDWCVIFVDNKVIDSMPSQAASRFMLCLFFVSKTMFEVPKEDLMACFSTDEELEGTIW